MWADSARQHRFGAAQNGANRGICSANAIGECLAVCTALGNLFGYLKGGVDPSAWQNRHTHIGPTKNAAHLSQVNGVARLSGRVKPSGLALA